MKYFIGERMSIILDTSFLIALQNPKDVHYSSALKIKEELAKKRYGRCYISTYVFDEFLTFLRAKGFHEKEIIDAGDALLNEETITILLEEKNVFLNAWSIFKKFNKLSFSDSMIVALAQHFGIKYVASYDKYFEGVPGIQRIC